MLVLTAFGVVALLLAAVGIYGVLSHSVARWVDLRGRSCTRTFSGHGVNQATAAIDERPGRAVPTTDA